MPTFRRYLLPALLLAPVILVCGKLIFTPVSDRIHIESVDDSGWIFGRNDAYPLADQRGWPWVYSQTIDLAGIKSVHWIDPQQFSWLKLLGNLLVATVIIAGCAAVLLLHRRRRGAWLRISIREVFAAIGIVAVVSAWCMMAYTRAETENKIAHLFGYMQRNYGSPNWLQRIWPTEEPNLFQRVDCIHIPPTDLSPESVQKVEAALRALPWVTKVSCGNTGQYFNYEPSLETIAEANLQIQKDLPLANVEDLDFFEVKPDDAVMHLVKMSPRLRRLRFDACDLTERHFDGLSECRNFSELRITRSSISDEAFTEIAKLESLEELCLSDGGETIEAGLARLSNLRNLRRLDLSDVPVSGLIIEGLKQFPALETLEIYNGLVNEVDLSQLAELPRLQSLTIRTATPVSELVMNGLRQKIGKVAVLNCEK